MAITKFANIFEMAHCFLHNFRHFRRGIHITQVPDLPKRRAELEVESAIQVSDLPRSGLKAQQAPSLGQRPR